MLVRTAMACSLGDLRCCRSFRGTTGEAALKRKGFTIVELVMTIVVLGMIIAIALPKLRQAWLNFNVRSARLAFDAVAERARTAAAHPGCGSPPHITPARAAHRGCVSTLNITTGSAGAVWVTACPVSGSATSDTVGAIEPLATRYGVTMTPSRSPPQYDPRGVSVGNLSVTVVFTGAGSRSDSAMINQLGKVVR